MQIETLGWLALFTLVIDVVDLRPQIKSFRFLASLNYGVYYVLRLILGGLAVVLISASQGLDDPMTIAFVGVLAGFTVLQNFAVKFGGESVVDITALFDGYRRGMITDESKRIAQADAARTMTLANELASRLEETVLENYLTTMIAVALLDPGQAKKRIGELQTLCGQDTELLKRALAAEMVQLNSDFVRENKENWYKQASP